MGNHHFIFNDLNSTGTLELTLTNTNDGYYETPVVFTDENAIVNANLKGNQLSNTSTAYESNSQRKIVRTPSYGYLYQVYESLGNIWLEKSTNNGANWTIEAKINQYATATSPSIDYIPGYQDYDHLVIVYEEDNTIKIACFYTRNNYIFRNQVSQPTEPGAYPVVACFDDTVLVVWKGQDNNGNNLGLLYRHGTINKSGNGSYSWVEGIDNLTNIANTDEYSENPTLEVYKSAASGIFRLAWDDNINVYYSNLSINSFNSIVSSNFLMPSESAGYDLNFKPSIVALSDGARLAWIGYREYFVCTRFEGCVDWEEQKAVLVDPAVEGVSWAYGDGVQSVNLNKYSNSFALAWGVSDQSPIQFTNSDYMNTIFTLSNVGKYVQLNNGEGQSTSISASAFNTNSTPYYFTNDILNTVPEKENPNAINCGREGVIRKDKAQFYFAIGDVKLNDRNVKFIPMSDSIHIKSLNNLSDYLTTMPMQVDNNSSLYYSILYGITDSLNAIKALKNNIIINFKLEMLDATTNEIISELDNVTYDSLNVFQYNNISYRLNTTGIGNRTVKLKLIISSNTSVKYSLKNSFATDNLLTKRNLNQTITKDLSLVTTYDISQNYPNPFNPSTTIKYQIPKPGMVTLKVYDILGKEVAGLVNEFQNAGRYNVNFDASKLASGVYIYQIRSNEYTSSKKMMLLK